MKKIILIFVSLLIVNFIKGQCTAGADLQYTYNFMAAKGDTSVTTPTDSRHGQCCGAASNTRCVTFFLTLTPGNHTISLGGNKITGADQIAVNCGALQSASNICLAAIATNTITLTFCKPGNDPEYFTVSVVKQGNAGPDIYERPGCAANLISSNATSPIWTSIYPGAEGAYNSYLSCTTCNSPVFTRTGSPSLPANGYIDYKLTSTNCLGVSITDTARVNFIATPVVISPSTIHVCSGTNNQPFTAIASGGTAPYSYLWSNGATTQSITPTASGTYTVSVTDIATYCGAMKATCTLTGSAPNMATFSYTGSPYCKTASNPFPTFSGGGVAGTFTAGAGLNFINTLSGQINIATSTPGTYTVTNTVPSANGCSGISATSVVTINPSPVTSASATTICSGNPINVVLTASIASSFGWIVTNNGNTTGMGAAPQNTDTIKDVLTNTTSSIQNVSYTVTPTAIATGCVGTPQTISVTIIPNGYWTGNVDRDWFNIGNWQCAMPDCSHDAFIPSSPTSGRFPQIGATGAVCRDLTISTGTSLEFLTTYSLSVCGNWLNNGTFIPASGTATFIGTNNQSVGGSAASNTFYNLTLNNTGVSGNDNVTLNRPDTVTNVLNLTDGILVTTTTNLLTLTNSANTATNGGNSTGPSFVSGPMRWLGLNGAGPFIFPTGKKDGTKKWARIAIKNLTSATDFQAEYFNTSFTYLGPPHMASLPAPALKNVSRKEWWQFDRVAGTGNGNVTLYWEDASWSGITHPAALKIGHWSAIATNNGGTTGGWEDNNPVVTTTGSCCTIGTITTSAVVTSFSPFTFSSDTTSLSVNPLPIGLLSFDANANAAKVNLNWATASEINNDFFTIEKTTDGVHFKAVGTVKGAGNSTSEINYSSVDNHPYNGVSNYRLKQTDYDGNHSYSDLQMVRFEKNANVSFNIYPNPNDGGVFKLQINADTNGEVLVVVYDVLGKEIYSKMLVTSENDSNIHAVDLSRKLPSGVYLITATSNDRIYNKKLIVN